MINATSSNCTLTFYFAYTILALFLLIQWINIFNSNYRIKKVHSKYSHMKYFVCRYVHPIKLLHFGIGEKFSSMGFFYIYFFDNMSIQSFTSIDTMGRCNLCVPHARVELVTYIFLSAYYVILFPFLPHVANRWLFLMGGWWWRI